MSISTTQLLHCDKCGMEVKIQIVTKHEFSKAMEEFEYVRISCNNCCNILTSGFAPKQLKKVANPLIETTRMQLAREIYINSIKEEQFIQPMSAQEKAEVAVELAEIFVSEYF